MEGQPQQPRDRHRHLPSPLSPASSAPPLLCRHGAGLWRLPSAAGLRQLPACLRDFAQG